MPDREWDVVNYLDSVRDACGYVEACHEDDPEDADFLRLALSDVARAKELGKFDLDIGNSNEELLQELVDTSHLSRIAALEIACALGMQLPIVAQRRSSNQENDEGATPASPL